MNDKLVELIPVSKEVIMKNIHEAGLSIRRLAQKMNCDRRIISKYLNRGEMPEKLVKEIDDIVRPKIHQVRVQFSATISISDDELNWLDYHIYDDQCVLDSDNADMLWDLKGDYRFDGATVEFIN